MFKKFSKRDAKVLIPKRKANANKSDSGRALIIAGSSGMFGAAVLSATAAARSGAGYVLLMTDLKKFSVTKNPDFLSVDSSKARISELRFDSAAIGPGLGMSLRAKGLLLRLMKFPQSKVVVDADALNLCAKRNLALPSHWIVTPHEAELARLINISSQEIKKKRKYYVRYAQKKLGCIVLLKGHKTLIASASSLTEVQSGNSALAKAGTGDVLTGIICGFLAQGLAPIKAASLGAFLHGYMADQWVKEGNDPLSLMASDLLSMLPKEIRKIRG